jgi:uncharacterized protein (TIGR02266 family)
LVDPNTRQGKRTPVTLKIKFKSETLEQFIERYAIDVSQGGIFIRTKEPLAVGTQMKFEFQLRDASPLIAGEGTVVWTRENDPSRPAIAPGMGVRFDRLADGSQGILERILAEKAKQAPQRPVADTTKPPMFSDTPTRVAPAPIQDALLGKDNGQRPRRGDEPHNDSHTPLPKPMPFHSDADEFPDEAFEEATKVRALDELIAQTAEGGQEEPTRRVNGRADATASETASDRAVTRQEGAAPDGRDGRDGREVPELPSPPELPARPAPRLLDTSPSPRFEGSQPPPLPEAVTKTRIGVEPAAPRGRISTPPVVAPLGGAQGTPLTSSGPVPMEAPPLPSGMRAVAAEQTAPARLPAVSSRSTAPIIILILVLVAAAGAAVWFFVLRPQHTEAQAESGERAPTVPPQTPPVEPPAPVASGGSQAAGGSDTATPAAAGSAEPAPGIEIVDTVITASVSGAKVEVTGTDQSGAVPFTAKLEKGKPYKARVTARGFLPAELEVKGGDDKQTAKLVAKPRVLVLASEPSGAVILVDSGPTGHNTPFELELTAAQAAKKTVRVQLRKPGYRAIDRTIDLSKLVEDDTRMVGKVEEKLAVAPAVTRPPASSARGSAHEGSDASSGDDSATPPAGGSAGSPSTPPSGGSAGSAEPEPEFNKHP